MTSALLMLLKIIAGCLLGLVIGLTLLTCLHVLQYKRYPPWEPRCEKCQKKLKKFVIEDEDKFHILPKTCPYCNHPIAPLPEPDPRFRAWTRRERMKKQTR